MLLRTIWTFQTGNDVDSIRIFSTTKRVSKATNGLSDDNTILNNFFRLTNNTEFWCLYLF